MLPMQVSKLQAELELKLSVIALPLDICVQHAARGESSLQGVLDSVTRILQDIERFEEALREQGIRTVAALPAQL